MNSGNNPTPIPDPQGSWNQGSNPFSSSTNRPVVVARLSVEARLDFIRKTYALFMAGLLCCVVGGVICLNSPAVASAAIGLWTMPILALVVLYGSVFAASAASRLEGLNYVALFAFTALIGVMFAPIIALYAPDVVGQAALLTVVTFGSLTAYVFITKKDFSYLGGMLMVGLVALVIGGIANFLLFHSSVGSYVYSWITVVLFSGFVLYDTSRIINRYDERAYCTAALNLFLDFFNMFMAILRILNGGRR